jgi:uncharacterized protein YbdZ (MbtH family)
MSAKKIETSETEVMFEMEPVNETAAVQVPAKGVEGKAAKNGNGSKGAFDPTQHLSNFNGRDYLEVKWRIMWLRSEHPDARIATEIVQHNEEGGFALFRAEVEIPSGGKSTGWGSETVRDFHDYIEAAETKAIGRALASLGYGTQFCQDFDFSANARPGRDQVVDAPVNLGEPRNVIDRASSFVRNGGGNGSKSFGNSGFRGGNGNANAGGGRLAAEEDDFDRLPAAQAEGNGFGATEKQVKAIYAIGRASKRLSESQVDDRAVEVFGVRPQELTKAEASQFIDLLKGEAAA